MTPHVTVIVPHHLDQNIKYLDRCLYSLTESIGVPFEVICISDSDRPPDELHGIRIRHMPHLDTATKKVTFGATQAHPDSKHLMFISDDVMVSRYTIALLAAMADQLPGIYNPMCNGDNGSQFMANIMAGGWQIPANCDLEDLGQHQEAVLSHPGAGEIVAKVSWLAFYCTLIPKSVYKQVGELDSRFDVRHNDQDYCYRASRLNIASFIHFGAFALHFGTKTLNIAHTEAEKTQASTLFQEKWAL